jgi:hypothetical protein
LVRWKAGVMASLAERGRIGAMRVSQGCGLGQKIFVRRGIFHCLTGAVLRWTKDRRGCYLGRPMDAVRQ